MKKRIAAGLLVLLLVPAIGSAQTVAELQAQLNQLMQLLAALQGTAPGTGPAPSQDSPTCLYLTRNLNPDDEDATTAGAVSRLQRFLANNPAWYPEGRVTGFYGPLTTRAVQRYQASRGIISYGLPSTTGYGAVGTRTRQFMAAGCTGAPPIAPTNPTPSPNPYVPPAPTPIQPLAGSITVDFRAGQYYEARGNGFYVQVISLGTASAVVDIGMPRCGNPPWPSGIGNDAACGALGSKRQVSLSVGQPMNVPLETSALTLQLVQIVNGVARIIVTPGTPISPTPTIPTISSITCSLTTNKSYVTLNEPVILTWSSSNATAARWIQGPFVGTSIGVSGSATLSSLTETKPFTIEFSSGSGTKTCSVNVNVRGEPAVTVSLPASGQRVGRGDMLAIAWEATDVPLNARVRLELYAASSTMVAGNNDNGILSSAPATGSYQWRVPSSTSQVVTGTGFITGFADGLYRIVAKLYTGDTCWGGCIATPRTLYANGSSAVFTVASTSLSYSQASYYSQSGYYSQSSYYGQGGYYYSQADYSGP